MRKIAAVPKGTRIKVDLSGRLELKIIKQDAAEDQRDVVLANVKQEIRCNVVDADNEPTGVCVVEGRCEVEGYYEIMEKGLQLDLLDAEDQSIFSRHLHPLIRAKYAELLLDFGISYPEGGWDIDINEVE